MLLSQCYLVTTVTHKQSPSIQTCVYIYIHTYSSQCREAGRIKETKKLRQQWQPRAKDTFPRTVLGTRALGSPTMVKSSVSQTVLAEPLGPVRCEEGFHARGRGSLTEKKIPRSLSQTASSFTRTHLVPYSTEGCASQLRICGENV